MSTVHSVHLTKRAVRLLELCEAEGFENIGELLEASICDSVCPGDLHGLRLHGRDGAR